MEVCVKTMVASRGMCTRVRGALAGALLTTLMAGSAAAQDQSIGAVNFSKALVAAEDAAASAPDRAAADPAQGAATTDPVLTFFKNTELSGFVDFYYGYNFNKVDPMLRNFDVHHNSFSLNLAEVALEKKPTADSRGGFRVDLDYGPTAAIVAGAEPVKGQAAIFQNIQQAYLSYLAPTGSGLQIDFGKFVTPFGYEVIESKDNWNYSRSLLFALAIPYDHVGVRGTYSVNDKVSLAAYLVNGWNNSVDNNSGKTFIGQVTLKPTSAFTIIENYGIGPEQTSPLTGVRQLSDTVATYTVNKQTSLAANFDYGHDNSSHQTWSGVAAYLRYQPNDWFALTPRYEYLNDKDSFMTGIVQKPQEFTATFEFKHKDGVIARAEYRADFSNQSFFVKDSGATSKSQSTFTIGMIYAFSTKAP